MDQQEWLRCTDAHLMLAFLRGQVSARKWRLLACACCRCAWTFFPTDDRGRQAVETAERFADGLASTEELQQARRGALAGLRAMEGIRLRADRPKRMVVVGVARASVWAASSASQEEEARGKAGGVIMMPEIPGLVRDLVGNPFLPITVSVSTLCRRHPTILEIAQAIYANRQLPRGHLDPALLSLLANALEEAGCTDREVFGHLRSPGPHVRGCWPVDWCLGYRCWREHFLTEPDAVEKAQVHLESQGHERGMVLSARYVPENSSVPWDEKLPDPFWDIYFSIKIPDCEPDFFVLRVNCRTGHVTHVEVM